MAHLIRVYPIRPWTWGYVSLLLAETTRWMKQTLNTCSIHHSENAKKGVTIAVQRCSVWCLCLRLEFIFKKKKKKTNRKKKKKKDEFHPKENPYTQFAQPPIFSYRNINSVRHQYNIWQHFMKGEFKYWCSIVPPISTKRTIT